MVWGLFRPGLEFLRVWLQLSQGSSGFARGLDLGLFRLGLGQSLAWLKFYLRLVSDYLMVNVEFHPSLFHILFWVYLVFVLDLFRFGLGFI